MKEILSFLYDQISAKLGDNGISIEARNTLVEMKQELEFLNKEPFTYDDVENINNKLEGFSKTLNQLSEKEDNEK